MRIISLTRIAADCAAAAAAADYGSLFDHMKAADDLGHMVIAVGCKVAVHSLAVLHCLVDSLGCLESIRRFDRMVALDNPDMIDCTDWPFF